MKKLLLFAAMLTAVAAYGQGDYFADGCPNEQWLKYVNDETYVANLLIPGAHDAATGEGWVSGSTGSSTSTCQSLTVDQLWDAGVRVFDIRPGIYRKRSSQQSGLTITTKSGNYYYYLSCNHGLERTNLFLEQFFNKLIAKLNQYPNEFAIIHLFMGTLKDSGVLGQLGSDYKDQFSTLYAAQINALGDRVIDFRRDLTVGDMKGKILILARDNIREVYEHPKVANFRGWSENNFDAHWIQGPNYQSAPLFEQDIAGNVEGEVLTNKQNMIKEIFAKTKSRVNTKGGLQWIFNFACGYADGASSSSYKDVSKIMNPLVYDQLASSRNNAPGIGSTGDKQVPYGIVMMDYVGDSSTSGDKAIQAIISSNFESQNVTGVEDVELESDGVVTADVVGYYNLSGQLVGKPTKGQVVVAKYSDGSARKLVF